MKIRKSLITILNVVFIGVLLVYAGGAKAAEGDIPFTLSGVLNVTGPVYSIQEHSIVVDADTACTPDCASLATKLVTVTGYIGTDTLHHATSITEVTDTATVFSYSGVLTAETTTTWTIDTFVFQIGSTVLPLFYKVNDTVAATYMVNIATGAFESSSFKVLDSGEGNTYVYSGTVTAMDGTLWTIGEYQFDVAGITLPPVVNINDTVEVTFHIENEKFVVDSVNVTETVVGNKVESSRCENRLNGQPAVFKLADSLGEESGKLMEFFCKGFGVGEIQLAYKYAANGYTPEMLLALRVEGYGWGQIKQMVASAETTPTEPDPEDTTTTTTTNTLKSNNNANSHANTVKTNNGKGTQKTKTNHKKP